MNVVPEEARQWNTGVWATRWASEFLLKELIADTEKKFLAVPFVAMIAAGIEGEINTGFVDYFHRRLGKDYREAVRPYLMMKLPDRLEQLPLLLSGFKYRLNRHNDHVKRTLRLFEHRNTLLHVKMHWHYFPIEADAAGNWTEPKASRTSTGDPYAGESDDIVSVADLRAYMRLYNKFIPDFSGIERRVNRRNFNPNGWFLRV